MCRTCTHTIHAHQHHYGWDNSFTPIAKIAPGDVLTFECLDCSGGQLRPDSTVAAISSLDFSKINPVCGPIEIDGAEAGDILKITIHNLRPQPQNGRGFGWTANIPGFGLLTEEFTDPALLVWDFDPSAADMSLYSSRGRVPLKPFAGTLGLAPAASGHHSVVPPRRVGGNLDIRDLSAGTTLYLPVEVAGGLFSVGDTHAAQGDGEVCGTAIESPFDITLGFDLIKQTRLDFPRFTTSGPVTRHLDTKGYDVTTGIGPDLHSASKAAVAQMVDLIAARENIPSVDAYMLASVCGDLRISEIVDMPNVVVSFYFPRSVFE